MFQTLHQFILGADVMAAAVVGLIFLRFWRKTGDRLFVIFAVAFWLLALNWLALAFLRNPQEEARVVLLYLIRLLAFVVILVGIWDKNRAPRSKS